MGISMMRLFRTVFGVILLVTNFATLCVKGRQGLYPFLRSGFRSPLPASTNRLELKSRQKQPLQKLQIPQRRSRQAIPTTKGRKQGLSLRRLHRDEAGIFQHVPFLDRNETGAYEKATAGSVHSCK